MKRRRNNPSIKEYVLGFVLSNPVFESSHVLLVLKKTPEWQAGRWNGIGGHIEETDESALDAMLRECKEETGLCPVFRPAGTMRCPGEWVCHVFRSHMSLAGGGNKTNDVGEELGWFPIKELPENVIGNLKWLIPYCLEAREQGYTFNIEYPPNRKG